MQNNKHTSFNTVYHTMSDNAMNVYTVYKYIEVNGKNRNYLSHYEKADLIWKILVNAVI